MYKRANSAIDAPKPLWFVGEGISTFAGPLRRNSLHAHSVPVLLTGLYGPFQLRAESGNWLTCRAAVVPAGIGYEFDMAGEPLSVIYLEPGVAGVSALSALMTSAEERGGILVSRSCGGLGLRSLFEDQSSASWAGEALRELLGFGIAHQGSSLDPRVALVLRELERRPDENVGAQDAARSVHLSSSRFQHLFAAEVGVPYRRYRAWRRMLLAIREIGAGANFTTAAHAAGYADQAHFAHHFRRLFGASASPSMVGVRG